MHCGTLVRKKRWNVRGHSLARGVSSEARIPSAGFRLASRKWASGRLCRILRGSFQDSNVLFQHSDFNLKAVK